MFSAWAVSSETPTRSNDEHKTNPEQHIVSAETIYESKLEE